MYFLHLRTRGLMLVMLFMFSFGADDITLKCVSPFFNKESKHTISSFVCSDDAMGLVTYRLDIYKLYCRDNGHRFTPKCYQF